MSAVIAESDRTGATVVAEGIETEAHEQWALDIGATRGQGYLYGPPSTLPSFDDEAVTRPRPVLDSMVTVRAPAAVTPYALVRLLGSTRRADDRLLQALEDDLLAIAASTGPSTMVLITVPASGMQPQRERVVDAIASAASLTVVFGAPTRRDAARYRSVPIDAAEPLGHERSIVVVSPSFTAALIALEHGPHSYRYRLVYDNKTVLDAATVLLRRIPANSR